jgi:hypothetical protein
MAMPATMVVLLLAGALLIGGALLAYACTRSARDGVRCDAAECGFQNVLGARYCARCGKPLSHADRV